MADLIDCARCGRRFVAAAADRVAGKLVCPACVAPAKQEATEWKQAAAEAAAAQAAKNARPPEAPANQLVRNPTWAAEGAEVPVSPAKDTTPSACLPPAGWQILKRNLLLAGGILTLLVVLAGGFWLWRSRSASAHAPLGNLKAALTWFSQHDAHPPVRFDSATAPSAILRGRELLMVPVFLDASKPASAGIYFDPQERVHGIRFDLPPPEGAKDAWWPGPMEALRTGKRHFGYELAAACSNRFAKVDLYPFTREAMEDSTWRATRQREWVRTAKPSAGGPDVEVVTYMREHRGLLVELLFWQETAPGGRLLDSMVIVRDFE